MNKWQLQEAKARFSELIGDTPSGTATCVEHALI